MDVKELQTTLKKIHEPKGYYFNRDTDKTRSLLEALIFNRERYGYMACPCRLAKEDGEADRDIICPCIYREDDVKEYGSCYCGLYVSSEWNDEKIPHQYVPERRPAKKC